MKRTALKRKTALKRGTKLLKKQRLDSIGKLKKRLWELCKQITRARYGRDCYTCINGRNLEGSNWQTGHFLTNSVCSTELKFDLSNLRIQCYWCNVLKSGNWLVFEANLIRDHGQEYVDELKRRNEATKGKMYDRLWYMEKIRLYEAILGGVDSEVVGENAVVQLG